MYSGSWPLPPWEQSFFPEFAPLKPTVGCDRQKAVSQAAVLFPSPGFASAFLFQGLSFPSCGGLGGAHRDNQDRFYQFLFLSFYSGNWKSFHLLADIVNNLLFLPVCQKFQKENYKAVPRSHKEPIFYTALFLRVLLALG